VNYTAVISLDKISLCGMMSKKTKRKRSLDKTKKGGIIYL